MKINVLAVDCAKNVVQLHGVDDRRHVVLWIGNVKALLPGE